MQHSSRKLLIGLSLFAGVAFVNAACSRAERATTPVAGENIQATSVAAEPPSRPRTESTTQPVATDDAPAAAVTPDPASSPTSASAPFGSPQTLKTGQSVTFADGLIVRLNKIDDSRCAANVQCIWAGELAPELTVHGGSVGETAQTFTLGTERAKEHSVADYVFALKEATSDSATLMVTKRGSGPAVKEATVEVTTPRAGGIVRSPLTVTGQAPGPWYFEGSFPVTLLDANGAVLARAPAKAQGEWMTTAAVPFAATLAFKKPITATGALVLEMDNPSGGPTVESRRVPIRFGASAADGRTGVHGVVTMGPTCPVERMPPDPQCADRPLAATFSIDTPTGAHVATVTSAADGSFAARLPAGTYVISLKSAAAMPSMAPRTFVVGAHAITELPLSLDSGIR